MDEANLSSCIENPKFVSEVFPQMTKEELVQETQSITVAKVTDPVAYKAKKTQLIFQTPST